MLQFSILEHPKNKGQSNHTRQQAIFCRSKKPLGCGDPLFFDKRL